MDIQTYLTSLSEQLNLSPSETQKILREIKSHLVQETASLEKTGLSRIKAEERACAEFGDPAVIAQGYRKMSSWFFRTSLRVVVLTLMIMIIILEIPGQIYRISSSYAVFRWHTFIVLSLFAIFAMIVFSIVQRLTFSTKRLRQLLVITLISVYFGGILYIFAEITFGMSFKAATEPRMLLALFLGQFIKIAPMILIYLLLHWRKTRTFSKTSAN